MRICTCWQPVWSVSQVNEHGEQQAMNACCHGCPHSHSWTDCVGLSKGSRLLCPRSPPQFPSPHLHLPPDSSRLCDAQAEAGSLPRPGNAQDGDKLLELVAALNDKAPQQSKLDIDDAAKAVTRKLASGEAAEGRLGPGLG